MPKEQGDRYVTRDEFNAVTHDILTKLDAISKEVRNETKPNWTALGVGLTVIITLCGAMFYFFNLRFELEGQSRAQFFQTVNTRIERVENNLDDDRKAKAKLWDNYLYNKVTGQ